MDDAPFITTYLGDIRTTRFLPLERPFSEEEAGQWLADKIGHWQKHGFGLFLLREKGHAPPIGYCGMAFVADTNFVDIRYGLIPEAQGRGLALEAARCCARHGFDTLGLKRIYGAALPENHASKAIMRKLGMKPDKSFDYYGEGVETFSVASR